MFLSDHDDEIASLVPIVCTGASVSAGDDPRCADINVISHPYIYIYMGVSLFITLYLYFYQSERDRETEILTILIILY